MLTQELNECNLAFVYGTLKQGFGNSLIFERHEAECLGPAVTEEEYLLVYSGCPMIYHEDDLGDEDIPTHKVRGDLWVIPNETCFLQLDRLEGHPDFYTRRIIEVLHDGEIKRAWCYEMKRYYSNWTMNLGSTNSEGEYEWP